MFGEGDSLVLIDVSHVHCALLDKREVKAEGMFASLIIRLFQLVFSVGIVFFSHNKSVGTISWLVFSAKRTGPEPCKHLSLPAL